ncbi:diphosphomevalonate decarboxylase-like [Dendronephthya gigantea]|uniref:diphosphomevalonate decarboxylase-like n=1 Tax=Dendronephthya gigantea TaxID=151771 RepID=UPI001069BC4D|nr:diphosphomevalonate decarboxylase-like [Dendronephthya gigantea]
MEAITCTAPVNLAVIKYWGKRDEDLILPVNSSLSVTLSQEQLCVTTTVATSPNFTSDRVWLNGSENLIKDFPRIQKVLQLVREECRKSGKKDLAKNNIHICSVNNFPTAAGLASSAAGHACLAFSLAKLFHLDCDISVIARQGSGSACRSIYGGFVMWEKGEMADGNDSLAIQISPESHWAEMRVLVLVVSDEKKETSSTSGMRRSVQTSKLLKLRSEYIVPQRITGMKDAILRKDFEEFANLTMKDSNQFHAICLDTFPPILPPYMNHISHNIVRLVTEYNKLRGTRVAYSFDAGPNAVLFLLENDVPECLELITTFFPPNDDETNFVRGLVTSSCKKAVNCQINIPICPGGVKYIIHTKIGDGPRILEDPASSLLTCEGFPRV